MIPLDIKISPGRLGGSVTVPPSKSAAHRLMLCAALAEGTSRLSPFEPVKDMLVTAEAVKFLGAQTTVKDKVLTIRGGGAVPAEADIDCVESGSTFRFLVPIAAALGLAARFHGSGRLPHRPIADLTDELARHDIQIGKEKGAMLSISGRLTPGTYRLAGNVSSQYITGLLYALPLLEGDSELLLTTPLESRGYVDMTIDALAQFGVAVETLPGDTGYRVPGGQPYRARDMAIEGDYSGAAFWLCAGALGSGVEVKGLRADSKQGDRAIVDVLAAMAGGERPRAADIDVSQIPDLMPALTVVAAFAEGTSTIHGAARLRLKESDRLQTVTAGLRALGAQVEERPDRVVVTGRESLRGGCKVDSYGDHRIAMAMAIAALRCEKPVTVLDAHCVEKSYPAFWRHMRGLGGTCEVL